MNNQSISPKVAVIGGSGLYQMANYTTVATHDIETPFGPTSCSIVETRVGDIPTYFLPRHGKGHGRLPHEIPFRANIYALKTLGVTHCIAVNAAGSLAEEFAPGDIVIPTQLIDWTRHRESTFFGNGIIAHPSMAEPVSPALAAALGESLLGSADQHQRKVHQGATYLCMEGPQFSTKAESHLYRSWGAKVIGMTMGTESKLAREAEIAYASICLITDYDCWREETEAVEAQSVMETLFSLSDTIKELLPTLVEVAAATGPCEVASAALDTALLTRGDALKAQEYSHKIEALLTRFLI